MITGFTLLFDKGLQMKTFNLHWAPEGRIIATIKAKDEHEAMRKTPMPYRKFMGEIYVLEAI